MCPYFPKEQIALSFQLSALVESGDSVNDFILKIGSILRNRDRWSKFSHSICDLRRFSIFKPVITITFRNQLEIIDSLNVSFSL